MTWNYFVHAKLYYPKTEKSSIIHGIFRLEKDVSIDEEYIKFRSNLKSHSISGEEIQLTITSLSLLKAGSSEL